MITKANKQGIYRILCIKNNKVYYGSTKDFRKRKNTHIETLRKNKHHSIHLQRAWNKYGEENFIFSLIEEIIDETNLVEAEQQWLDKTQSYDPEYGYNISKLTSGGTGRGKEFIVTNPQGEEFLIFN